MTHQLGVYVPLRALFQVRVDFLPVTADSRVFFCFFIFCGIMSGLLVAQDRARFRVLYSQ